ncbi:MAG: ribbon-helix-helix protein, CopG family [Elusimicrobia bacterium]|nr:ribbon-helix-helix protein, CopG family [Elusimicrobiota bacterium]
MKRATITFRLDTEKKRALDAIAASTDRDRSYVLNEAITSYLEVHEWQLVHIREGIRQADAGRFARPGEVSSAFAKWRK